MSLRKKYIESSLPIQDELLSFFDKNDKCIIFDIGACEAEDSIRYSSLFSNSKIYSFEPNPDNILLAKKNITDYNKKNIFLVEEALSDKIGVTDFYVSSGNPTGDNISLNEDWNYGNKSSSILPPEKITRTHNWLQFNKKITVQTNTISNFCKNNNIENIDFIHMDVQGAELKVLEGASDFIRKIKMVWLEVATLELYKKQALQKDVEKFMLKNGFVLYKSEMKGFSGDQLYLNKLFYNLQEKKQTLITKKNILKSLFNRKNITSTLKKESYSQSGEDLIVKFVFDTIGIKSPSYIDIGAHHPFHINNTAIFYEQGCKGVNIEPNPDNIALFEQYRKKDINLNIGIGENEAFLDYYKISSSTLNTFSKEEAEKSQSEGYKIDGTIKVKVKTLKSIINEYLNGIFPQFLTIDVEGMDEQILSQIDYEKNAPIVICIETISFSKNGTGVKNSKIIDFLNSKGYFVYADTYINTIFVKTEKWIK